MHDRNFKASLHSKNFTVILGFRKNSESYITYYRDLKLILGSLTFQRKISKYIFDFEIHSVEV